LCNPIKDFSKLLFNLDNSSVFFLDKLRKYLSKALHVGFLIETRFVLKPPSLSLEPINKLPARRVLLKLG